MLLGNKKTGSEKRNWCVVLNPIPNEIDKKRIAYKIADVFSLSSEEATDLAESTPIILLDHLSYDIAAKVKSFFEASNAELIITNDTFRKRRFYRTVWPEPPNLSFLNALDPPRSDSGPHEVLAPDEALNEIRLMDKAKAGENVAEVMPIPTVSLVEREQLQKEVERWKKGYADLEGEVTSLRRALEMLEKEHSQVSHSPAGQHLLESREREIQEAKILLSNMEERYQVLKKEYQEARHLFEEKMARTLQESEAIKKKNLELEESTRIFQSERLNFGSRIKNEEEEFKRSQEEAEKMKRQLEDRLSQATQMIEEWRHKAEEFAGKAQILERAKENLDRAVKVHAEQITRWRERHEVSAEEVRVLREAQSQEKMLRERAEEQVQEIDKERHHLHEKLSSHEQDFSSWESKYREVQEAFSKLRRDYESQGEELQKVLKKLEASEAELEVAKRQLTEMHTLAEEKDIWRRKDQLVEQLEEKERHFQDLVHRQERIEDEIREREQEIEKILAEQEVVEREIIEGKQVRLHFSDQAKRERSSRIRIDKVLNETESKTSSRERTGRLGRR